MESTIPLYPGERKSIEERKLDNLRKFRETPLKYDRKYRIEYIATDTGYTLRSLGVSIDTSEVVQNDRCEFKLVGNAADYDSLFTLLSDYEAPYGSHRMAIEHNEQGGFNVFEEVTIKPLKRVPQLVAGALARIIPGKSKKLS